MHHHQVAIAISLLLCFHFSPDLLKQWHGIKHWLSIIAQTDLEDVETLLRCLVCEFQISLRFAMLRDIVVAVTRVSERAESS